MCVFVGSSLILADEPTTEFYHSRSHPPAFTDDNDGAVTWCRMAHEYTVVDDVNGQDDSTRSVKTSIMLVSFDNNARLDATRLARRWTHPA